MGASAAVIWVHHLGYREFRGNRGIVLPIVACGLLSLAYLLTRSPIAPAGGHFLLHAGMQVRGVATNHLALIRAWFGGALWELPPADAEAYFGKVLRDAKPSTRAGRAATLTGFFQLLELRHKVTCRYPLEGRVGSLCACLRSSAEQAAGR